MTEHSARLRLPHEISKIHRPIIWRRRSGTNGGGDESNAGGGDSPFPLKFVHTVRIDAITESVKFPGDGKRTGKETEMHVWSVNSMWMNGLMSGMRCTRNSDD